MSHPTDVAEAIEGVAIIGMAGRFPGAATTEELWTNLRNGVESLTFFSEDELLAAGIEPALLRHPNYVKAKGVLDGIDRFDARFFGYTPQEARVMDPQHRIFLECGWHALEDAGYCAEAYPGAIGVFAGANFNQYIVRHVMSNPAAGAAEAFDKDFLSTRLSYKLNLKGPSLVVQTACSTSLVAVAQACQSLLTYQCDMALAGGIAVHLPIQTGYMHHQGGILSPDGHCRAFDANALGTVVGSGVGIVVLKRLADAIADGDAIRAVIRGFAVNNDGSEKMGYTAPSIEGQAQVVATALALAGVDAGSIGCVEAHGTGTELGDPIEIAALTQAFRATTARTQFCAIGSVKTNIGHLDSAAGVAGLIKTALMLERKEIPPSLHFERPNPKIDFAASPFFVNTKLAPWKEGPTPRRAGVSSFGIGGTNAHLVLEEPPARQPPAASRLWHILPLSARTPASLSSATENLVRFLEAKPDTSLADVSYTLQAGRKAFKYRRAVVCRDAVEAVACLRVQDACEEVQDTAERQVVFAFPGARFQAVDAQDLYRSEATFREAVDRCAAALDREAAVDARRMFSAASPESAEHRDESRAAPEAALFAFEYGLAQMFISWGITPTALVGEGVGELVAACVSGMLGVDDALRLASSWVRTGGKPAAAAATTGRVAAAIQTTLPQLPSFSLGTGVRLTQSDARDADYWTRLRIPAVSTPVTLPPGIVLQCGAGESLATRAKEVQEHAPAVVVPTLPDDLSKGTASEAVARALAQIWTRAVHPDWAKYHSSERRYRVALPLYPFESERFWVERERPSAKKTLLSVGALHRDDFADWFHVLSWKRSAAPALAPGAGARACLVFEDDSEICGSLVGRLGAAGCALIRVRAGTRLERGTDSVWTINASAGDDYVELIRQLADSGSLPSTIVHAWGLTGRAEPDPDDQAVDRLQRTGFYSLLYLAQAIGMAAVTTPLRLVSVTDGVHEVVGGEPLVPEKATVIGPCRVIPQEYPSVLSRHVDLRIGDPALRHDEQLDAIVAEIFSPARDLVVAYRSGRRWIQICDGIRLEPPPDGSHPRLRRSGVYLVTGGLGGVGLVLAEHLAEACGAKLILTGRRGLPPRGKWDAIVARSADEATSRRIRAVQKLEALGAEVLVADADVADEQRMRAVVAESRARFGRIDGVIHAAGVAGGGVIQLKKSEVAAAVLAPKVAGARILGRIFRDEPPSFLLLCSSMTSLVGGVGQVDYCAANAYLDTFARQFGEETGAFSVSVNWNTWREVGMAVDTAVPEDVRDELKSAMLSTGITNRQGVDAFLWILAGCTERQVAISPNDLALLGLAASMPDDQRLSVVEGSSRTTEARPAPVVTRHPRPTLQTPYVAPRNDAERRTCDVWQELLGIDRIGVQDNFFDLGGHSLLAIRVMARFNEVMGTKVPVARLYDGLTVAFLAGLDGEHGTDADEGTDAPDDADRRRDRLRRQRELQTRRREAMKEMSGT